jgi:hypothetical protein
VRLASLTPGQVAVVVQLPHEETEEKAEQPAAELEDFLL